MPLAASTQNVSRKECSSLRLCDEEPGPTGLPRACRTATAVQTPMGTRNVEIRIPDGYKHAPVCICIIRGAESDGVNGVPFPWLDPEIWRHPNVELTKLDSQMLYFWLLFGPIR